MEPEKPYDIFINSSIGEITADLLHSKRILAHQYLQFTVATNEAPEISLVTLRDHRNQPFNLPNTSISHSLIAHQLQQPEEYCIIDCSKATTYDIFLSKTVILKGYEIQIKYRLKEAEAKALYELEALKRRIEMDFSMNDLKPAFLGEVYLDELHLNNPCVRNVMDAYQWWSQLTNCPIYVSCTTNYNSFCLYPIPQPKTYGKIREFLDMFKPQVRKRIVLWNPPFCLKSQLQVDGKFQTINESQNDLQELRKWNIILGFDLLRYRNEPAALILIGQQIISHPDNTIISAGVLFKTDLCSYAGQGYSCPQAHIKLNITPQLLRKVENTNIVKLMNWKKKEKIVIQIKYWKCSTCNKESEEAVLGFKKFQKKFCSMACLRNYKFS